MSGPDDEYIDRAHAAERKLKQVTAALDIAVKALDKISSTYILSRKATDLVYEFEKTAMEAIAECEKVINEL